MKVLQTGTIPFSVDVKEKYGLPSGSVGHYRIAQTGMAMQPISLLLFTTQYGVEVDARSDGKLLRSTLYFSDGKIVDRAPATISTNVTALQEVYAESLKNALKGRVGSSGSDAVLAYESISGFFEGEAGIHRVQLGGKLKRSDL